MHTVFDQLMKYGHRDLPVSMGRQPGIEDKAERKKERLRATWQMLWV
jgi:hypothetical protein